MSPAETFEVHRISTGAVIGQLFGVGSSLPVCLFTCSSLLQPQPLQDLSKLLMLADVWQFDVDSGSESGPQVRRTGEDVAQVFVPHELVTSLLKQGLDLPERERERQKVR